MDIDDALVLSKHLCQAADIYKSYYERSKRTGELEPQTEFEYRRAAAFLSFLAAKAYPPGNIHKVELCISAGWMAIGIRAYNLGWKLVELATLPEEAPPLIYAELLSLQTHLERMTRISKWYDAPPQTGVMSMLLENLDDG